MHYHNINSVSLKKSLHAKKTVYINYINIINKLTSMQTKQFNHVYKVGEKERQTHAARSKSKVTKSRGKQCLLEDAHANSQQVGSVEASSSRYKRSTHNTARRNRTRVGPPPPQNARSQLGVQQGRCCYAFKSVQTL